MAYQEARALKPQIAAKAVLKPVGRNSAFQGANQQLPGDRALAGFLGGLTAVSKRQLTVDWPLPSLNKITAENRSRLMIAENQAAQRRVVATVK